VTKGVQEIHLDKHISLISLLTVFRTLPLHSFPLLQVGSTPGVTKGVQEIHLDKHIRLLDSPGIVFTSGEGAAAAALRNAIKVRSAAQCWLLPCQRSSSGCWTRRGARCLLLSSRCT
jgi:hypothetical protein